MGMTSLRWAHLLLKWFLIVVTRPTQCIAMSQSVYDISIFGYCNYWEMSFCKSFQSYSFITCLPLKGYAYLVTSTYPWVPPGFMGASVADICYLDGTEDDGIWGRISSFFSSLFWMYRGICFLQFSIHKHRKQFFFWWHICPFWAEWKCQTTILCCQDIWVHS